MPVDSFYPLSPKNARQQPSDSGDGTEDKPFSPSPPDDAVPALPESISVDEVALLVRRTPAPVGDSLEQLFYKKLRSPDPEAAGEETLPCYWYALDIRI